MAVTQGRGPSRASAKSPLALSAGERCLLSTFPSGLVPLQGCRFLSLRFMSHQSAVTASFCSLCCPFPSSHASLPLPPQQEPVGMGTASFPIQGRETRVVVRCSGNRTCEMRRGRGQMQGRRSWLHHALPACYPYAPKHSSGSWLSCTSGCENSQSASSIHRVTAPAMLACDSLLRGCEISSKATL